MFTITRQPTPSLVVKNDRDNEPEPDDADDTATDEHDGGGTPAHAMAEAHQAALAAGHKRVRDKLGKSDGGTADDGTLRPYLASGHAADSPGNAPGPATRAYPPEAGAHLASRVEQQPMLSALAAHGAVSPRQVGSPTAPTPQPHATARTTAGAGHPESSLASGAANVQHLNLRANAAPQLAAPAAFPAQPTPHTAPTGATPPQPRPAGSAAPVPGAR